MKTATRIISWGRGHARTNRTTAAIAAATLILGAGAVTLALASGHQQTAQPVGGVLGISAAATPSPSPSGGQPPIFQPPAPVSALPVPAPGSSTPAPSRSSSSAHPAALAKACPGLTSTIQTLEVSSDRQSPGDTVFITATITNTGAACPGAPAMATLTVSGPHPATRTGATSAQVWTHNQTITDTVSFAGTAGQYSIVASWPGFSARITRTLVLSGGARPGRFHSP